MAFFGCCAPALPGTICHVVILPIKPVIAASNSGSARGCSPNCCRNWRKTYATREAGSERVVHRRQLQFGEKRGSAVGPTRRGKGSKIMAISDGHGLPLAVHVASASPHETKLVEPTI